MKGMRCQMAALGLGVSVVAALLSGCDVKTSDRDLSFIDPTKAEVLVQGRKRLLGLAGTTKAVCVDPRSRTDYLAGHIPGAIHLPLEHLRQERHRLADYQTIIVYGNTYNSPVSLAMSKSLIELGFKDVQTLRGGLRAWELAGNPVEEGPGEEEDAE